jgi:hypothetical protein
MVRRRMQEKFRKKMIKNQFVFGDFVACMLEGILKLC